MSSEMRLGELNGHSVGIIMKEMVRRALVAIRNQRQVFEAQVKESYSGTMDDVFTSADTKAQEIYIRSIRECFPNAGVLAEESYLHIEPTNGCTAYFTIDPLDGTKAFVRRQSHGVGSMIALVDEGEVLSAFIGDVNTMEIYGYRHGSKRAHRITEFNNSEELTFGEKRPLKSQYVLLRDRERAYTEPSQKFMDRQVKDVTIDGGSIGIWLARLWKREVGAAIIPPGWETPWDSTPVIGISEKLGYVFLHPQHGSDLWIEYQPDLPGEKKWRNNDTLIVHQEDMKDFEGQVVRLPR